MASTGVAQEAADQETEEESGGLFGSLRKMIPKDTESLRENLDSAWKSGREGFQDMLDSTAESSDKMDALLEYLDEKLAGRESTFTDEEIEAYADKLIPMVEELNERKFTSKPKVKAVGNLQLIQALAKDLAPQYERQFPEVSKPLIYLQSYLTAGLVAPSLLGKYGVEDGTVYIVPLNLESTLSQRGVEGAHEDQILQLVIGHELTHALQDQELGLSDAVLSAETRDASKAFEATIEGHAVFIQNQLAAELGFGEAANEASQFFIAGDLQEDSWLYERLSHAEAVGIEQVYAGGNRFIEHHHRQGGIEDIWKILDQPPPRSSMITLPETYTENPAPLPDYKAEFADSRMAELLGDDWALEATSVGDFDLRTTIAQVNTVERETIMRGMKKAVYVMMPHKTELARSMDLMLFEFGDKRSATAMMDAVGLLTEQNLRDLESNSRVKVRDLTKGPYSADTSARGYSWNYKVEAYLLGETAMNEVLIRHGNFVASFIAADGDISQGEIDQLIAEGIRVIQ